MARLNPRRRWLAKQDALQRALLTDIRNEHGPAHDDSALLQQGPVKSAMGKFDTCLPGSKPPRSLWEGMGTVKRPTSKRFSSK
jgi:hypothetical protein